MNSYYKLRLASNEDPEKIFIMVSDIEKYPNFLKFITKIEVKKEGLIENYEVFNKEILKKIGKISNLQYIENFSKFKIAEVFLKFHKFLYSYNCLILENANELKIKVILYSEKYVETFKVDWEFNDMSVDFNLEYKFKSSIINSLFKNILFLKKDYVIRSFQKNLGL